MTNQNILGCLKLLILSNFYTCQFALKMIENILFWKQYINYLTNILKDWIMTNYYTWKIPKILINLAGT